jgi:hypothetical protein
LVEQLRKASKRLALIVMLVKLLLSPTRALEIGVPGILIEDVLTGKHQEIR